MMRHARRATMLVAFSLLALAATAYAESAWVLWKREAITPPDAKAPKAGWGSVKQVQWTNIKVGSNRKDCEELLAKTPAPSSDMYYVCFPDTVDPRGPKGEMNDTDARLWHPWLRINRLLR